MTSFEHESATVTWLNSLFNQALACAASDIHFEPGECLTRVRFRQSGRLCEIGSIQHHFSARIMTRIKILSHLDIAEKRLPQDGRLQVALGDATRLECRVSTCPTLHGEKIVLRLVNPTLMQRDIEQLGLSVLQQQQLINALRCPQGMILVTGPTGSGKTATLYAALNYLNHASVNIMSAEDPIEIKLPGINQVNLNAKIGLSYANLLRAFLRQDPDILMIGEIRDAETAGIALRAAQTGHLVLSTVHTNSAAETMIRLKNLGVAKEILAESLILIIAQRLLKKQCLQCVTHGYSACQHDTLGRMALFEVMPISPHIKQLILSGGSSSDLFHQAQREGMLSLAEVGQQQVKAGLISATELREQLG